MYQTLSKEGQDYQKLNHYKNKDNSMRAQWDRQNRTSNSYGPRQSQMGDGGSINAYQRQKPLGNTLSFGSLGGGRYSNHNVQNNNLYAERYGKNLRSLGRSNANWSDSFKQSPALQQMYHNANAMLRDGIQDGERDRLDSIWRDISGTGGGSFGGSQRKGLSLDNLF